LCIRCCTLGYVLLNGLAIGDVLLNGFSVRDVYNVIFQLGIFSLCISCLLGNLVLSFFLRYSRYKEVRDALDVAIVEMQKNALDLKKVSAEHYVPAKDYVSVGLLSNACFRLEQIADILDATYDKI
jgi:hypothetical protein